MTPDLDTLLLALCVETDDHVIPAGNRRPGQSKHMSDAEMVGLAVGQVLPARTTSIINGYGSGTDDWGTCSRTLSRQSA